MTNESSIPPTPQKKRSGASITGVKDIQAAHSKEIKKIEELKNKDQEEIEKPLRRGKHTEDADRLNSATEQVERCRRKLLDITKRNRLISFKHREISNREIRIIDALPDVLYDTFLDGKKLKFCSLPDEDQSFPDENTSEFLRKFEQAELSESYRKTIEDIEEEGKEDTLDQIKEAERDLKNKIREELNLPVWKAQKNLSNAEVAKKHGFDSSYEISKLPIINSEERPKVRELQTLLMPEEMSKKLNLLSKYIRSDIEELGVNTLYVVFGFLEWYESASSDQACVAPLLLLQLEIEKKRSANGDKYIVQATGEEPEINRSLLARLDRDFKIQLPKFTEGEKLENYWNKISKWISKFDTTIPQKDKWRIRRFITVAHLNFSRLVMYQDIGEAAVSANKIVQKLFLESNASLNNDHDAEDYDVDTPKIKEAVPLLITSADASQHSALVDVMEGKNLAIKGPPGTGKSQTITNIIACAIAKGKKVLFLAEKMAALNVVHKRLREAGLDLYCLELHSTKARKKKVVKSIAERLNVLPVRKNIESFKVIEDFQMHRDKIEKYLDKLHSTKKHKRSIRDYMGLEGRYRDRIKDLHLVPVLDFEEAIRAESQLQDHIDDFDRVAQLKKEVDEAVDKEQHPWYFITNFSLDEVQEDELKEYIKKWKINLEGVQKVLFSFKEHFQLNIKPSDLSGFLEQTKSLARWCSEDLDERLVDGLENKAEAEYLSNFVEGIDIYRHKRIKSLEDILSSADRIEEIKQHLGTASELGVEECSAMNIRSLAEELKIELELWDKYLPMLLTIGKDFGVSESANMDKIYALVEMPDYITSVSRDCLLFRTEKVIDERNTERLKNAVRMQKDVRNRLAKHEEQYDLSILGPPEEIRLHAAAIEKAGFWAFFDSSYRKAKKLFNLASKCAEKFKATKVAIAFKDIASTKEKRQKIEQDQWLRDLSGLAFKGLDTDIEQLQKINEWAMCVRKRYGGMDEFSRSLRQWLLTTKMEELDSVSSLASDQGFIAFKEKTGGKASLDTPIQEHCESINDKKKKLKKLFSFLDEIASRKDVTFKDVSEDLAQLKKLRKAKEIAAGNQRIKLLFGERYAGMDTIIQDVEQKTALFIKDCLSFSEVPNEFETLVDDEFPKGWYSFIKKRPELERLHQETKHCVSKFQKISQASETAPNSGINEWMNVSYADQISLLQRALERANSLRTWIDFHACLEEFKQKIGGKLLSIYQEEHLDFEMLPEAFKYMIYRSILKKITPTSLLSSGKSPDPSCRHIKELDKKIMDLQKKELCNELAKKKPIEGNGYGKRSEWTEGALLNNEISKQKRHIPIRKLMYRASESIQNIKPCFLMSPLSVATYLDPKKFTFDLVVIDEASQMRTEDALGGIVRSKQLVVVGDPQQLPPTSFFSSKDEEVEEEKDDHESIMDMALSTFWPPRTLSRHYRSAHESLIAFSNYQFYEDKLWVFPSPTKEPSEQLGIRLIDVEGTYSSSTNEAEVKAIVQKALCFMQQHPDRSLGIATMNKEQQRLIEGEMERAFEKHQHAEDYETKWRDTLEPFFVKNLENVQGDERDAIFISTVYGPDSVGNVAQRFGPINNSNGHRRLNVLFTRAKKNMVVFTSLKSGDITSSSEGAQALKGFLSYAKTGNIARGRDTHLEPESPFEEWVKERLEDIGCEVHPQVGEGKFRIDLGIKHPKYPYGYLMGIECDGARYHSSKSARERDVIRQKHLEKLGWNIHRIWSTDWWSNSKREVEKIKAKIEKLLQDKLSQEKAKYPVPDEEVDQTK